MKSAGRWVLGICCLGGVYKGEKEISLKTDKRHDLYRELHVIWQRWNRQPELSGPGGDGPGLSIYPEAEEWWDQTCILECALTTGWRKGAWNQEGQKGGQLPPWWRQCKGEKAWELEKHQEKHLNSWLEHQVVPVEEGWKTEEAGAASFEGNRWVIKF